MSSIGAVNPPADVAPANHHDDVTVTCESNDLINEQKRICRREPETMPYLLRGLSEGFHECRNQFQQDRWNCTGSDELSWNGPTLNEGETTPTHLSVL